MTLLTVCVCVCVHVYVYVCMYACVCACHCIMYVWHICGLKVFIFQGVRLESGGG